MVNYEAEHLCVCMCVRVCARRCIKDIAGVGLFGVGSEEKDKSFSNSKENKKNSPSMSGENSPKSYRLKNKTKKTEEGFIKGNFLHKNRFFCMQNCQRVICL